MIQGTIFPGSYAAEIFRSKIKQAFHDIFVLYQIQQDCQ